MKTHYVEGIGSLQLNPTLKTLQTIFSVFAIISLGVVGLVGLISWIMTRNPRAEVPWEILIPGLIALPATFVSLGLVLIIRRKYSPGDFYMELDRGDAGEARAAAQTLLKLTGTDALKCKLKAKAHLCLAYQGESAHWAPLIALLNSILDQEPDNVAFRLDRGQAYQHVGNYDGALKDLEPIVTDTAYHNLRAYSIRLSCLTALNRLDEARLGCDHLEKSIERFPNRSEVAQAVAAHRAEILQRDPAPRPGLTSPAEKQGNVK